MKEYFKVGEFIKNIEEIVERQHEVINIIMSLPKEEQKKALEEAFCLYHIAGYERSKSDNDYYLGYVRGIHATPAESYIKKENWNYDLTNTPKDRQDVLVLTDKNEIARGCHNNDRYNHGYWVVFADCCKNDYHLDTSAKVVAWQSMPKGEIAG